MATPFIMPKFDMDQESARVVEWLKKEGDSVELDEIVLVVETDKVAIDVPSPAEGFLTRISADVGDEVPVTTVIAYILAPGEDPNDLPPLAAVETVSKPVSSISEPHRIVEKPQQYDWVEIETEEQHYKSTPVARKMARRFNIDLSRIEPAGDRITRSDIERFVSGLVRHQSQRRTPATPAARRLSREWEIDLTPIRGSGPAGRVQEVDVRTAIERVRPEFLDSRPTANKIPLTGMRKTIADKMQSSFQTAPHISLTREIDVTAFERERARINIELLEKSEKKITVTALLVKAIAKSLSNHPLLNASIRNDQILVWKDINIGVATALDDGLIVPVIRAAYKLSSMEISHLLGRLSEKARGGQLALEDVQDGTFTLTNLGMFDIDHFRAIINPPESAILAVGRVVRKPVAINEQDEIGVRPVMKLTLSADHRVVDGVVAARFLADLGQAIENPNLFMGE